MKQRVFGMKKRMLAIVLAAALLFVGLPQVNTVVWAENEAGGTEMEGGTEIGTVSQNLDGYQFFAGKTYDGVAVTLESLSGLRITAQKEGADDVILTAGENCEVEMKSSGEWKNAGDYELAVKQKEGAGYTFQEKSVMYQIAPFPLSEDSVTISTEEIWWTGDEITGENLPKAEVKNWEHAISDSEYQISYKKQGEGGTWQAAGEVKDAGTYGLTVTPADGNQNLKSKNEVTKTFFVKYDDSITDESFSVNGGKKKEDVYYYASEAEIRPSDGYEILADGMTGGIYQDGALKVSGDAGDVTFRIRKSDEAGGYSGREFTVRFVKDTTGPVISFQSGVYADTNGTLWGGKSPVFDIKDNENGIGAGNPQTVQCRIGEGEWKTYDASLFEGLQTGTKCGFRALDLLGNAGSSEIFYQFDGRNPEITAAFHDSAIDFNEEGKGILRVKKDDLRDGKISITVRLQDAESGIDPEKTRVEGERAEFTADTSEIKWTPQDADAPQPAVLSVTAGDYAGNTLTRQILISYDPKAPEIGGIRLNGLEGKSEIKAKEDVVVSAAVTDDTIDGEEQLASVKLADMADQTEISMARQEDGQYQATVTADEFLSGQYKIVAKDQAGNVAESGPLSIFIAKKAPQVAEVAMDQSPNAEGWINKDITFTVKVNEPDSWPEGIKYGLQYQKTAAGQSLDSDSWADMEGDTFQETDPTFDGVYYFRVKDEAGNVSPCGNPQPVKKDKTAPEAEPGEILAWYDSDGSKAVGEPFGFLEGLDRFFAKETIDAHLYIPQDQISGVKSIEYEYDGISGSRPAGAVSGMTALVDGQEYAEVIIEGLPQKIEKQAADTLKIIKITDYAGNERKETSGAAPVATGHTALVIDNVRPKLFVDYLDSGQEWTGKKAEDTEENGNRKKYYGRANNSQYKEIKLSFEERFFEENKDPQGAAVLPVIKINGEEAATGQISWEPFQTGTRTVAATLKLPYIDQEEAEYVITVSYQDGSKNDLITDDAFWKNTKDDEYVSGVILLDDKAPEITFRAAYTDQSGKKWGGAQTEILAFDSGAGMPDPEQIEFRAGENGAWKLFVDSWADIAESGTKYYFRAADRLGNKASDDKAAYFYLDKSGPGIGVTFQGKKISFDPAGAFALHLRKEDLRQGAAVFSLEIRDTESGVKEQSANPVDIKGNEIVWKPDHADEPQYALLSIEACDYTGNVTKRKISVYYDPKAPEIDGIRLNGLEGESEIKAKENVAVSAEVTDELIENEEQLASVELVNMEDETDARPMARQKDGRYQAIVTADVFLSGRYKIVAKDRAGNKGQSGPIVILIAKKAPEISLIEINQTPNAEEDGGWINKDITFTVEADEPPDWPEGVKYYLQYQKTERGQAVLEPDLADSKHWNWVTDGGKKAENATDPFGRVRFSYLETDDTFDGIYYFRLIDEAGNVSLCKQKDIRKDKVAPGADNILVQYRSDLGRVGDGTGQQTPPGFFECVKRLFAKETIDAYLYIPQDQISGVKSIEYKYGELKEVQKATVNSDYAVQIDQKEYAEVIIQGLPKNLEKQIADTLKITKITDFAGNELTQIQGTTPVAEGNTILVIDNKEPELSVDYLDSDQKWEGKKSEDTDEEGGPRKYYGRIGNESYKEIKLTFTERFFEENVEENADGEQDKIKYPAILINDAPASEETVRWGKFDGGTQTVAATLKLPYIDGQEAEYVITTSYQDGSENKLVMNPGDPFWRAQPDKEAGGEYQSGVIVLDDTAPEFTSYEIKEEPAPHKIDGVNVYANKSDTNDVTISFSIMETPKYWHKENVRLMISDLTHGKEIVTVTGEGETLEEESGGNGNIHILSYRFDGEAGVSANYRVEISYTDMAGNEMVKSEAFELGEGELEHGTYRSEEFILDHAAPVFGIRYDKAFRLVKNSDTAPSNDQKDAVPRTGYTAYYHTDIAVTVTIEESYAHAVEENGAIASLSDFSLEVNGKSSDAPEITWKRDAAKSRYTGTFTLDKEGSCQLKISYKDAAGNAMIQGEAQGAKQGVAGGKYESEMFVIDKTAPVLAVSYTDRAGRVLTPSYTKDGRSYFNQKAYLKVEVKENNFRNYELKDSLKKFSAYTIEWPDRQMDTQAENYIKGIADERIDHNAVRSFSVPLTTEAYYDMPVSFEDLAGNAAREVYEHSCVDTGKPQDLQFSYSVEKAGYLEINNYKDSGYAFADHKLAVKVAANDSISGIREIEFTVTDENGQANVITKDFKPSFSKKTSISLPLSGSSFKGSVSVKVTDYASNAGKKEQGQIVETEGQHKQTSKAAITTKTKPSRSVDGEDYYNSDVELNVTLEDTYSGIGNYEYTAGSAVKESKNYKEAAGTDTEKKASQKIVHKVSKDITLSSQENNQNDVKVLASFTDNAGHVSKAKETYNIDVTDPVIKVTYDLNDPLNETYYKDTRTATVVITERNFDENDVVFTITNTDGSMPAISNFDTSGSGDETTHTATVTFSEDGDYTFGVSFTDLAGNTAEYESEDEFTIDKTLSQYTVTYDNDNVNNEYYYDAQRTATVDVLEHNFDPASVTATVTKDNASAGTPSFSGWSKNGDHNTATVTFSEDGEYTFTFTGMDLAGNEMDEYAQDHFVVDVTEPEIEIFNIENMSANNGKVQPGIRYHDTNYDANATVVEMTGFHNGKVEMAGTTAVVPTGVEIKMDDFAYRQEMDDLYTMKATVYDKAGNSSEAEVTFSVNRFGSVYTFDSDTDGLVGEEGAYYTNEKQDIVVTETNVDTLGFREITCNYNGELSRLAEGEDYTVSKSGSDGGWKQYTYTIGKELFEGEGVYALTIYSEDEATNRSDNNTKGKKVEFVLDETPPSVLVSGVEDNGQYREDSKTATVSVEDNVSLSDVTISAGGKKQTYTAARMAEANGEIALAIPSKNDWQTLSVTAYDAAGNRCVFEGIRYLVTANFLIQFMANKPLFYGSLCIAVFLALGIFLLVMAKRRKNEEG